MTSLFLQTARADGPAARVARTRPVARVRQTARSARSLPRRIRDLEAEVQENRQLNRRIAELTDIVTELLVPIAERDEERVRELLAEYRRGTLAP